MSSNIMLVVQVVMSIFALGLVIKISPKVVRKANDFMLGLTTDFSGEDSDQHVPSEKQLVAAITQDEVKAKRDTVRTRRYFEDRADAELDNELHDRMRRRSRLEALNALKEQLHEGKMVQYISCRSGLRQARIIGYSTRKGKGFTARLRLMGGSNVIVRRHVSRLIAA